MSHLLLEASAAEEGTSASKFRPVSGHPGHSLQGVIPEFHFQFCLRLPSQSSNAEEPRLAPSLTECRPPDSINHGSSKHTTNAADLHLSRRKHLRQGAAAGLAFRTAVLSHLNVDLLFFHKKIVEGSSTKTTTTTGFPINCIESAVLPWRPFADVFEVFL